ncbi:nicotinamide riboside transporter PnuC [Burkholderiaceae bacterium UC74_6]
MSLLSFLHSFLEPAFTLLGSPISWLEIVAFALSIVMVVLNMRVNPLAWPLAIAASVLYGWLFFDGKLYGEGSLQIVFVALACWGWWQWLRGKAADGEKLHVQRLSARGRLIALGITLAGWPLLGVFLARVTDSPLPYWDALPTVGSLVGQWLLGRKYAENWPTWVAVNAVSVVLFALKGYWLTVVLYGAFVPMSVIGWRQWRLMLLQQQKAA